MTEDDLRKLFAVWIDKLGLSHWSIEIEINKFKPRTTTMQAWKSPHYDRGRIVVQPWVISGEPPSDWHPAPDVPFVQVIEETVVHELLHLLLWNTTEVIGLLRPFSKRSAFETAIKVQENEEENFVDRLSCALVYNCG